MSLFSNCHQYCELYKFMLQFCNKALMAIVKPTQWYISNIIHVHKSGNQTSPDNYRGIVSHISWLKHAINIIRIVIRISSEKRTIVSQILAIRRIIKDAKNNLLAVLTFIVLRKLSIPSIVVKLSRYWRHVKYIPHYSEPSNSHTLEPQPKLLLQMEKVKHLRSYQEFGKETHMLYFFS